MYVLVIQTLIISLWICPSKAITRLVKQSPAWLRLNFHRGLVSVTQELPQVQPHHLSECRGGDRVGIAFHQRGNFFWHPKNCHLPSLGHITVTGQPELAEKLEREWPGRDGHARRVLIIIRSAALCTSLCWTRLRFRERRWKSRW